MVNITRHNSKTIIFYYLNGKKKMLQNKITQRLH